MRMEAGTRLTLFTLLSSRPRDPITAGLPLLASWACGARGARETLERKIESLVDPLSTMASGKRPLSRTIKSCSLHEPGILMSVLIRSNRFLSLLGTAQTPPSAYTEKGGKDLRCPSHYKSSLEMLASPPRDLTDSVCGSESGGMKPAGPRAQPAY